MFLKIVVFLWLASALGFAVEKRLELDGIYSIQSPDEQTVGFWFKFLESEFCLNKIALILINDLDVVDGI